MFEIHLRHTHQQIWYRHLASSQDKSVHVAQRKDIFFKPHAGGHGCIMMLHLKMSYFLWFPLASPWLDVSKVYRLYLRFSGLDILRNRGLKMSWQSLYDSVWQKQRPTWIMVGYGRSWKMFTRSSAIKNLGFKISPRFSHGWRSFQGPCLELSNFDVGSGGHPDRLQVAPLRRHNSIWCLKLVRRWYFWHWQHVATVSYRKGSWCIFQFSRCSH